MHKQELLPRLFKSLFPNGGPNDPRDWAHHVHRHLVPEVQKETARFYGQIDCLEVQYPGLDYANAHHRLRLSSSDYPHHRRLFRAFDKLRPTEAEIRSICRWEGTLYAKETYETRQGTLIKDTTWDHIHAPAVDGPARAVIHGPWMGETQRSRQVDSKDTTQKPYHGDDLMEDLMADDRVSEEEECDEDQDEEDDDEEEEEEEDGKEEVMVEEEQESEEELLENSVGVALNERLIAGAEARARGEPAVLDPAFEQWMKEQEERGLTPFASPGPSPSALQPTGAPFWGQSIPEVFSYGPGMASPASIRSLRAALSRPPTYPPLLPRVAPATRAPPPAPPAAGAPI